MTADDRVTAEHVLAAIVSDKTHTIWSPCTTLSRMGIEQYPHRPSASRLAMKRVLESLHAQGLLVQREALQSYFTFKEVAYERVPGLHVQQGDGTYGLGPVRTHVQWFRIWWGRAWRWCRDREGAAA